jgi:transcriptional regulator of arginine metabolism
VNRRERQNAILRLVRDRALSTQAELVQALRDEGHEVVQTTVSRDVTELGLVKVRAPSGRLIYAAPGRAMPTGCRAIGAAMRRYATGVEAASSGLVVVTTPSGYASALAQAIDEGAHPSIAGTLAGDNTIFIAGQGRNDGRVTSRPSSPRTSPTESRRDALVGPRRRLARPVGLGLPPRGRRRAAPYDCEASLQHARRLHGAGLLSDDELAEVEERLAAIAPTRAATWPRTRTCTARSSGSSATSGGRSTRADRATIRSRPHSGSTCSTPVARRRGGRSRRSPCRLSPAAEAEADTLLPGYTHLQRGQPVTLGHHLPRVDRDARSRPIRVSPAASAAVEREPARLPARSPARRSACQARRTRCATRSTRSPTATSRSTTSMP